MNIEQVKEKLLETYKWGALCERDGVYDPDEAKEAIARDAEEIDALYTQPVSEDLLLTDEERHEIEQVVIISNTPDGNVITETYTQIAKAQLAQCQQHEQEKIKKLFEQIPIKCTKLDKTSGLIIFDFEGFHQLKSTYLKGE